jgi:hypothetical protein
MNPPDNIAKRFRYLLCSFPGTGDLNFRYRRRQCEAGRQLPSVAISSEEHWRAVPQRMKAGEEDLVDDLLRA